MSQAQTEDLQRLDDDEIVGDGTTEAINVSSDVARFEIDGVRHAMKPRERRRFPTGYCAQRVFTGSSGAKRDPLPSVIELLTNKRVLPVADPRAKALGVK